MSIDAAWVVMLSGAGLALVLFFTWRVLRTSVPARDGGLLTDGAVLVVSDGLVQQASPGACALLGACAGRPVAELLRGFLDASAGPAIEAAGQLEITGDPVDILVRTGDGRAFELIGAPAGALIRIVLREARYLDERLRETEARIRAAENALRTHSWEQDALHALVAEAPIIAWHRAADGTVNWSAGRIVTRTGGVTPEMAVELIVARMRVNRQPALAGEPQKSRIEIVVGDGAETVSLHVVEIVRQDGSRIGFATDAGTAAAAERTLARFVQTMTETFAHLTVGLAIFDRNQTLALFNPALVQMWQVEPAWLARRPSLRDILDELRSIRRLPELEDFHSWRGRLLGLFENTEAADYEELWHLADGSNIRVLARPHPHGALAFTFDDISERMRLEQRYRHSIDLRRATLDGLTEGIAVFGANGLLQFVNQAFHEIWGTDGDTVYAAMHARQLIALCEEITAEPEIWQKLHGFITGEESRRAWTTRLGTISGRALIARFAPLPDGSTLTVFSDMTESERVADALLERDAALDMAETARTALSGLFAARSTPALDNIEAQLGALDRAGPLPDEARHAGAALAEAAAELRAALGGAARIAVRSLLPTTNWPANGEPGGDPAETLTFVAAILAPRAAQAGVALLTDAASAPGRVACPAGALGQITFQLGADAIGRSEPGGTVVLRAEGEGDRFTLRAECSASRPPRVGAVGSPRSGPAADAVSGEALIRLGRLVARQGGHVEIEQGPATGPGCVTCHCEARRPERSDGGAPGGRVIHGGTVLSLKPKAG